MSMLPIADRLLKLTRDYRSNGILADTSLMFDLSKTMYEVWEKNIARTCNSLSSSDNTKAVVLHEVLDPIRTIARLSLYSDIIVVEDHFPLLWSTLSKIPSLVKQGKIEEASRFVSHGLTSLRTWLLLEDLIQEGIVIPIPPIDTFEKKCQHIIKELVTDTMKDKSFKHVALKLFKTLPETGGAEMQGEKEYIIDFIKKVKAPQLSVENFVESSAAFAINSDLTLCGAVGGIPTTDNPREWDLLTWRIEHDRKKLGKDFITLAALQKANIKFLDAVDTEFIKFVREQGYLSDLRAFFREKFRNIVNASNEELFNEAVREYSRQIIDEVSRYKNEWKVIEREASKRIKITLGTALVGGGLSALASFGLTIPVIMGEAIFTGGIALTLREFLDKGKEKGKLKRRGAMYSLLKLKP